MKLQLKRKADTLIGKPALISINMLARILGLILRRSHSVTPVNTILLMKFQGMGSLVITKPALRMLRTEYPKAKIIFWGTAATAALAKEMPEFDEIVILRDKSIFGAFTSLISALFHFWRLRIDWTLDLEVYSKISSVLTTLTCARNRAGFAVDSVRYRHFTHTHLLFFNRYEFLGLAYCRLVGLLLPANMQIQINLETSIAYGNWKFELTLLSDLPKKYFVVNVHAGELALERKWPKEYFESLVHQILDHSDLHAVLIGHGAYEIKENSTFKQHLKILNLTGKLSLQDTVRCLAHAKLVLSNDTAPLHLALSTSAPVLGLFGPTKASTYFPSHRPQSYALGRHIYCSPCVHHWDPPPCSGNNQCMKTLSVREVWDTCKFILPELAKLEPRFAVPVADPSYYPGLVYDRSPAK